MNATTQKPAASEELPVENDELCTDCGYNLRGLPMDAYCPECGSLVVDTVRGDGWETAPPDWVQSLRQGAGCLRLGVRGMPLLIYPGVFAAVVGAWRLTVKRPGDDESWMTWNKRLLARWVFVVGGLSMVGFAGFVLVLGAQWLLDLGMGRERAQDIFWGRSAGDAATVDAWFIGTHIAFAMGCIMLCEYVRALGKQVPDGALVAATTRLWRRTAVLLGGLALMGGFAEVAWWIDGLKGYHVPLAGTMVWTALGVFVVLGLVFWWWWGLHQWAAVLHKRLMPKQ